MGIRNLKKFMRILIIVIIVILIAIFCYYFFFLGQTLAAALTSLIGVLKTAGWWLLGGAALAAAAVSPKTAGGMLQDGYNSLKKVGSSATKRGKELWSWLKWVVIGGVAFAVYNKASEKSDDGDARVDDSPSTARSDEQVASGDAAADGSLTNKQTDASASGEADEKSAHERYDQKTVLRGDVQSATEPVNSKDGPDTRYVETEEDEPLLDKSGADNGRK